MKKKEAARAEKKAQQAGEQSASNKKRKTAKDSGSPPLLSARGHGEKEREKSKRSKKENAKNNKEKVADKIDEEVEATDMPIDPNEPVYCYCQQVSWGEMVACDNNECQIEWFHYSCAGLKSPPRGKWFCKDCIEKLGIQLSKKR